MPKARLFLSGSSGQAGQAIAALLSPTYEIIGLDRVPGPFTTQVGDLLDRPLLRALLEGCSAIVHTASLHAPHVGQQTREAFVDTNIKGTLYLLEAAQAAGVPKLIYTSTTSLYGHSLEDPDKAVWVTEDLAPRPRDIYDISKVAAEALCEDFFDAPRLRTLSLRVSRFWQEPIDKRMWYRMYRGLDVRDVAQAHALALDKDFDGFEVFNISGPSPFRPEDLPKLKHCPGEVVAKYHPEVIRFFAAQGWPLPPSIDRVYVIDKAKALLGYRPQIDVAAMMGAFGG